ncbi:MAG: MFS transporter [Gammaproteobacteria bacterium]
MSKDAVRPIAVDDRRRWYALAVICLGVLMIALDLTIVNVALPSIGADLKFSDASLVWVVNSYMLTFGGFLLLGGRLGDVYGARKLFLIGLALFAIASLACGLATTQMMLAVARAVQGLGGAAVVAVALSLIMQMFPGRVERAKAFGAYNFACSGGGCLGLLLGGVLTSTLNWRWVFLVNLPIGIAVYALCRNLVPETHAGTTRKRLDVWGAVTVTAALMLATYVIQQGNDAGWASVQTLGLTACAVALLAVFLIIEARISTPLVPLGIFRVRSLTISSIVSVVWAGGAWVWFVVTVLYMQQVLGYGPMRVALVFLPSNMILAALSLGLAARLVTRFGTKRPLSIGMLVCSLGLALLAQVPNVGSAMTIVAPSMILLAVGAGVAFNSLALAGMEDVDPRESGVASGILNTAFLMGGALSLAISASLSTARSGELLASGANTLSALTGGYQVAFLFGAVCAGLAAMLAATFLRTRAMCVSLNAEPAFDQPRPH